MKLLHSDFKHGTAKVQVENLDDLWYLFHLILPGDRVSGTTMRKIKIGKEGDRNQKIVKKPIRVTIEVEKVDFARYQNTLRIGGIIILGPDDVTKGSHHTFPVEENTTFTIEKDQWHKYQINKLKEASRQKAKAILLVVMDRDEAYVAQLKRFGYDVLSHHAGSVQKKTDREHQTTDFYKELEKVIVEYDKIKKPHHIIIASPAFFKEDFLKQFENDKVKKKVIVATVSSCTKSAFDELLKRSEVEQALHEEQAALELKHIDALLVEISKEGKAAYGMVAVEEKAHAGAVEKLLLTDSFIQRMREEGKFSPVEKVMHASEKSGGEIHIISSEHEGGAKLNGLGGIGAILRYASHD